MASEHGAIRVCAEQPIGPDVERYVSAVREYVDAGVEHVYIHQVGPDQEGFFSDELLPALSRLAERQPVAAGG